MLLLSIKLIFATILGLLGFATFLSGLFGLFFPSSTYKQQRELLRLRKKRKLIFARLMVELKLLWRSYKLLRTSFLSFAISWIFLFFASLLYHDFRIIILSSAVVFIITIVLTPNALANR